MTSPLQLSSALPFVFLLIRRVDLKSRHQLPTGVVFLRARRLGGMERCLYDFGPGARSFFWSELSGGMSVGELMKSGGFPGLQLGFRIGSGEVGMESGLRAEAIKCFKFWMSSHLQIINITNS